MVHSWALGWRWACSQLQQYALARRFTLEPSAVVNGLEILRWGGAWSFWWVYCICPRCMKLFNCSDSFLMWYVAILVCALFVQLPSGQFSTLNITNLHNFWQKVKCNANTVLASHCKIECCSHQLFHRKRKIKNWMLQSSTASSRTKKWIMNVAVMNQFFETREMNVAVINWFLETKKLKFEHCSHQLIIFEPKIWNWTLQSTIIWNLTACACNCQLVSESGKLLFTLCWHWISIKC